MEFVVIRIHQEEVAVVIAEQFRSCPQEWKSLHMPCPRDVLPMMAVNNSSRHETAFTVSIEAREGVSTEAPQRTSSTYSMYCASPSSSQAGSFPEPPFQREALYRSSRVVSRTTQRTDRPRDASIETRLSVAEK